MTWQFIIIAISALMLFGFVAIGVVKFGWLTCYSAYGPKWGEISPLHGFNLWSFVTILTAVLLIPVIVEAGNIAPTWQFAGFLCPALLLFVGLTPDYGRNKMAGIVHSVCVGLAALLSVVYILCVFPQLWWLLVIYVAAAAIATVISGKDYWCLWFELAAYLGIYTTVLLMI